MPYKKLTLILASLLVIGLSFSYSSGSDTSLSFQNKSVVYQLAALSADDDLDSFDDFEVFDFHPHASLTAIPAKTLSVQTSSCILFSLPCFLRIRNLRI